MSESEQENRKLYIAAILHILPELSINTERAALDCAVWSRFLKMREL